MLKSRVVVVSKGKATLNEDAIYSPHIQNSLRHLTDLTYSDLSHGAKVFQIICLSSFWIFLSMNAIWHEEIAGSVTSKL